MIRASLLRNAMPAQSGKLKKTVEFENFISEHECLINHTGSAGSMEAKGVVECFQSSVENRKLRYTKLMGMETLKHTHQLLQLTHVQE